VIFTHVAQTEDMDMRTALDFTPLFRSTVGFDRMLGALEAATRATGSDNWPPYDIVRTGENEYRIDMAVAGVDQDDITITQERNTLTVTGHRNEEPGGQVEYLHRGIAGRGFERQFELVDHVNVVNACLVNGLLTIKLHRELPEAMKPRRIEIRSKADPVPARIEALETVA